MATFRHNIANVISAPFTFVKLSFIKLFFPNNLFYKPIERFSPNVVVDLDRRLRIVFGNRVSFHSGCRISAKSGGDLEIMDGASFNIGCMIVCRYKVRIGKGVAFGPNVVMFDHDHVMHKECGAKNSEYKYGEIVIGDNTWIGTGTVILAGTHIGRNCVIGAGSVVKGTVPDHTVLIQKRECVYKDVEYD